ncbi:hypothetical protein F1C58_00620 [Glaciihabitans sp. INWT7]|uniref:hypothetical protein n=1 Tax=Glaciihabitans sp. INWT7 TaxID=2596912 RepID=UPI00162651ED|nr:hypothetical protein [Glaciihabitans sp. INWT7]QNE45577.1 hypothetical protein F1C58_00620 [Glaciihabitans sp. INWT7]
MNVPGSSAFGNAETRRFELTLKKPWFGWVPKPTVVFDGRGNPAQWGTGTWMVPTEGTTVVGVFLFNRLWRFGDAQISLDGSGPSAVTYSAPWLPFLRGRLRVTRA